MTCSSCNGSGVIETGSNDLPCDCSAGDAALFNTVGVDGPVTGQEMRDHFLNQSPQPIQVRAKNPTPASHLPGRAAARAARRR